MKTASLLFAVLITVPVIASDAWPQEPTEFRGVPFGATVQEAQAVLGPLKCEAFKVPEGLQQCSTKDRSKAFTVNDRPVYTHYAFYQGRFVAVSMSQTAPVAMNFKWSSQYEPLREAFEVKFGPPTEPIPEGGRSAEWKGERMRVFISEGRAPTMLPGTNKTVSVTTLGYAVIETNEWIAARESAVKAANAKQVSPF